jgi:hypothetical protein
LTEQLENVQKSSNQTVQIDQNVQKSSNQNVQIEQPIFICECGKKYLGKSGLWYHKKNACSMNIKELLSKDQFQKEKEEILKQFEIERHQFQKEKEELQKQIEIEQKQVELEKENVKTEKNRKTIETLNNTNNNLNIQINAFGCENLEYITDKFKIKCLNQIYKSIPEMVAKIHFNTKYPENHNVKIPNKKLSQVSIMTKDHTWKTVDKKTAITSIVDKSFNILDETFEEHKNKLTEHKRHNYVKYQDKFNKNDKELHKQLENEVEYMVVDETRR